MFVYDMKYDNMDNTQNSSNNDPNKFTTNGKFDIGKFNDAFDQQKADQKEATKNNDEYKLRLLNSDVAPKSLYESTVSDILYGVKNTWFFLLDDLLQQKFTIYTFTRDNRLFFIGITLIVIALIVYLYNYFSEDEDDNDDFEKYKEVKNLIKQYEHNKFVSIMATNNLTKPVESSV